MEQPTVRNIADIAKLAGVSKSTVSRALNDSPLISEATKQRIRSIARAHHFNIDHSARMLSLQRTQTLAAIVPIAPEVGRFITDPFNMELMGAVAEAARDAGYDLLLAQAEPQDDSWVERLVHSKRVDGVIMLGCPVNRSAVEQLGREDAKFIVWGERDLERQHCTVVSDDLAGGLAATRHLLEIGRKKIAFIGGGTKESEVYYRQRGYESALGSAEIAIDTTLITHGDYSSRSGYEAMGQLLECAADIDGVIVCSDVMAIGAMEALRASGRRIPDDVAVVGYDGIALSAHCSPPLTTIQQRISQAGRLLVNNLLQFVEDGIVTNTTLPIELVVRQSTQG